MRALKAARQEIQSRSPDDPAAHTLADLVMSLETEAGFQLSRLYTLSQEDFELAIEVLRDWRLDRYYIGRAKLFDLSWQQRELREESPGA